MAEDIAHKILHDRENGVAMLLAEYRDRLYSMALVLCRDKAEAEDLVFCAIERAIDKIDTFKNQDSLYSWLCVILVNLYRDSTRKKVNKGTMAVGGATEIESFTEPVGPDGIVSAVDSGFVRQALESLPESMREVLVLHYFMDMPTAKIAKFLAQPVGTIKSRLHYARLVLGARLGVRLKKPAVALIAAGLFLLAAASAMVSALADSDEETRDDAAVCMTSQAPSEPQGTDTETVPGSGASADEASSAKQTREKTSMTKTTIGSLFRKAVGGITTLAMTVLAANATYGDDPYIESDGTSGISTGYRMKGTSRLEVDFAPAELTVQSRIFGDDSGRETGLKSVLYISGGATHFAMTVGSAANGSVTRWKEGTDTLRHTAIFDLPANKVYLVTGGVTNIDETGVSGGFAGAEANMPLPLFGRYSNSAGTAYECRAKARIYSVKIYESNVLVRDFVPCLKDGVACFKDLVNGGFIVGENVAAFTAGGDVQTCADDAYVSTAKNAVDGKLYIDTGYKVSAKTAVALDYAFTVNSDDNLNPGYWSLFECSGGCRFRIDFNKYTGLRYTVGGNADVSTLASAFGVPTDDRDVRRTVFLDNLNTSVGVVMSGYTNQTATFTVSTPSKTDGTTLKLASTAWGSDGYSAIKIYGCKIWEDGALVRDFVPYVNNGTPGMRDDLTGAFIEGKDYSGGGNMLAYGGIIGGEQDAYLQSNGSQGINTGYKMNGTSRLEVDFALTTTNSCKQWRIFGTDSMESSLKTYLYIQGDLKWAMLSPSLNKYSPDVADTRRHTAIMDRYKGTLCFITDATTNWSASASSGYDYSTSPEADMPLPLFGRYSNSAGTAYECRAKARIYSVRIYELDELKHEFIPYDGCWGGNAGFYDTVTGEVVSNGSSFTFGGKGQDHGQPKAYIKPGYGNNIRSGESTTLTAYAPGATSYRWLCDGKPIDGGTDGVLDVVWTRGGVMQTPGFKVHSYQAIAVFEDFYGVTRESEPSAAANVKCCQLGMTLIIK